MCGKAPKRPRDMNQLAKLVSELATGQTTEVEARSAAAAILGRKGRLNNLGYLCERFNFWIIPSKLGHHSDLPVNYKTHAPRRK